MFNLFSSFDLFFYLITAGFGLLIFALASSSWQFSVISDFKYLLVSFLSDFFYSLKPKSLTKSFTSMSVCIFLTIFLLNFFSVFSYFFPATSQVSTVLYLSMSLWAAIMGCSVFNNSKGFLSHCIPEGTPILLVPFIFLIELVSCVIRPITLTVRLVANILAGHLLMTLLASALKSYICFFAVYMLLNLVELAVSLIQAYIFVTMTILYFSEV